MVKSLHDQAMALNEKSIVLERNGDIDAAKKIAEEAFNLEFQAASLLEAKEENEPTRSILYCSAVSIAVRAGAFENAKNAAKKGLEGFPDLRIMNELTIYQLSFKE